MSEKAKKFDFWFFFETRRSGSLRPRNCASGQFWLQLLDADFLEVDKLRVADVQCEFWTIGADGIAADGGDREFVLLEHVAVDGLAVQAAKRAGRQFRVHRMRSHHLSADSAQLTDLLCPKSTDSERKRKN